MLTDGDPSRVAPTLFATLIAIERSGVARFYRQRLKMQGRGDPRYPDDEPPEKVAKRALLQGTWAIWFAIAGVFLFVAAAALSNLVEADGGALTVAVLVLSFLVFGGCLGFWGYRALQIRRYFDADVG